MTCTGTDDDVSGLVAWSSRCDIPCLLGAWEERSAAGCEVLYETLAVAKGAYGNLGG